MSINIDYGPSVAEIMERDPRQDSLAVKREAAIKYLGTHYVCHKRNRVKKLAEPLPDFYQPSRGKK